MKDVEIAALCNAIYGEDRISGSDKDVIWDHFDSGTDGDGVCWGIKRSEDSIAIVFRGSLTLLDWLRDLNAVANPFHHDDIGPVHPGFLSGMRTVERELMTLVSKDDKLILAGHSLGAARATVLAALLVTDGWKPAARVVFGEPKPGFLQLISILADVPGRSYRNGDANFHDVVTDLPFSVPPEEYVHPTNIVRVTGAPDGGLFSRLGLFSWHHMPLYLKALGG